MDLTLVILVHNNQNYINRIFKYYKNTSFPIVVADSSDKPYFLNYHQENIKYIYYSSKDLVTKISEVLDIISTTFIVLCGVDDFIVYNSLPTCIEYLKSHPEFSSIQGNCISYKIQNTYKKIEMNVMYKNQLSFEISDDDPLKRLISCFKNYRTIFSAIHYTKNLKLSYQDINGKFSNLFLNEYLIAIIPLIIGKHKEFPIFYQMREFDTRSGGHSSNNLDVIFKEKKNTSEINDYLEHLSTIISKFIQYDKEQIKLALEKILRDFGTDIIRQKKAGKKVSISKKIGNLIGHIPFIGKIIILERRLLAQRLELSLTIHSKNDRDNLRLLKKVITEDEYSYFRTKTET